MLLLEFSMSPLDKGESLSEYVARSLDIIHRSGVPYRINPMGTVLEGEWDEVMAVVGRCYQLMRQDCRRIACQIKIDHREGPSGRLAGKVETLQRKTGRDLAT